MRVAMRVSVHLFINVFSTLRNRLVEAGFAKARGRWRWVAFLLGALPLVGVAGAEAVRAVHPEEFAPRICGSRLLGLSASDTHHSPTATAYDFFAPKFLPRFL